MKMKVRQRPITASHSQLVELKKCRFKWLLNHGLGIKPTRPRVPAYLGGLVHDLLQRLYIVQKVTRKAAIEPLLKIIAWGPTAEGLTGDDIRDIFSFLGVKDKDDVCRLLRLKHNDVTGAWMGVLEERDIVLREMIDRQDIPMTHEARQDMMDLADSLMWNHWATWGDHDAQWYQIIDVEGWFSGRVYTPTGRLARDKYYRGRRDLVVRDLADGRIKIIEHKTTISRRWEAAMEMYRLDTQGIAYVAFGDGLWGRQDRPNEVIYNLIRTKLPGEPKLIACPMTHAKGNTVPCSRCGTTSGRSLDGSKARAVSTAAIDTTAEMYRTAVDELGVVLEESEDYQSVYNGLVSNWFFHREPITVTDHQIEVFEIAAYRDVLSLGLARLQVEDYKSANRVTLEKLASSADTELVLDFPRSAPWACMGRGTCEYVQLCSQHPNLSSLFSIPSDIPESPVEDNWDDDFFAPQV